MEIVIKPGINDTETRQPLQVGDVVDLGMYRLPSGEWCVDKCVVVKPALWQDLQAQNRSKQL